MASDKGTKALLVVVSVLLLANLIGMVLSSSATPAQAQGNRTCVGIAAVLKGDDVYILRAWSNGDVEGVSRSYPSGSVW